MSVKVANPYLNEFELQRVLTLIGYLATDPKLEGGKLCEAKQISFPGADSEPSEENWLQVAKKHPEFFAIYTSISGKGDKTLLLRLRERNRQEGTGPLDSDQIHGQLHGTALRASDLKRNWYSIWTSLATGLVGGAMAAALIQVLWRTH